MSKEIKAKKFRRAFSFLIPLCLFAVFISSAIISVGNDMYAFLKPEKEVSIVVAIPTTLKDFSLILEENEIIENPIVFEIYTRSKNKTASVENFSGEITLNSAMSYRQILEALRGRST